MFSLEMIIYILESNIFISNVPFFKRLILSYASDSISLILSISNIFIYILRRTQCYKFNNRHLFPDSSVSVDSDKVFFYVELSILNRASRLHASYCRLRFG